MSSFFGKLDNFFPIERNLKETVGKANSDTNVKPFKPVHRTKRVVNILNN